MEFRRRCFDIFLLLSDRTKRKNGTEANFNHRFVAQTMTVSESIIAEMTTVSRRSEKHIPRDPRLVWTLEYLRHFDHIFWTRWRTTWTFEKYNFETFDSIVWRCWSINLRASEKVVNDEFQHTNRCAIQLCLNYLVKKYSIIRFEASITLTRLRKRICV